jgi:GntR family transcriptional regulator/MocR family aminotransferase
MAAGEQTLQQSVFDRLRQGILSGALGAGSRLPPSRTLAEELGVARQTVVLAYERLAAEGYVRPRLGSGTYVAGDLPDAAPAAATPSAHAGRALSARGSRLAALPTAAAPVDALTAEPAPALLSGGIPAPDLFPTVAWGRCAARVLKTAAPGLAGYPPPQGLAALRAEIAAHLAATRGLLVDPDAILVTAGTQQALRLAAELLLDGGDAAWVENPGYIAGRGALLAAGARLVPVPSGTDGIDVAAGIARAPEARLALVAPSHATPLGGALPVGQRLALLEWAARADAWLLEDDCDTEFRWAGKPLPPLASLDRGGRVIYCGSFSKCLAPALRLGFAVVPAPLMPAFVRLHTLSDRGSGSFTQAVLAAFMHQGLLAPHVRRMRTEYARRRNALLAALARHAPMLSVVPAPGGLHLTALLANGMDEAAAVRACRARGLAVAPLGAYYLGQPALRGLVMGFATTPAARAMDAARRLGACLAG